MALATAQLNPVPLREDSAQIHARHGQPRQRGASRLTHSPHDFVDGGSRDAAILKHVGQAVSLDGGFDALTQDRAHVR